MTRLQRFQLVAVGLAALIVAALIVFSIGERPADAQSSFDQRLIQLVNNYRQSKGIPAMNTSSGMSNGSLNWSQYMSGGSATGSGCGAAPNYGHDPSFGVGTAGNPAGTIGVGENINYACGLKGSTFPVSWSYGGLPSYCTPNMDHTTPELLVCSWIDSAPHRANIESASFNWIGSGTVQVPNAGYTLTFSTHRFARANAPTPTANPTPTTPPVPPVGAKCLGRTVTVDLSRGQSPTEGNDVIQGTNGADTINAGGGDDVICGWGGNDTIRGDAGDDLIDAGWGDDSVMGFAGHDNIEGSWGNDTIHGNRGNDVLSGGPGDDRIFGYAHNDTISGGDGNDRLHGNYGDDIIDGGQGDDRIFGYGDNDTLRGGNGNDLISGNFGNDFIQGDAGNDRIYGADGNDNISGGDGDDTIDGNSLNDTISGGAGNDTLDGGIDFDTCNGNGGYDYATRCETVTGVP